MQKAVWAELCANMMEFVFPDKVAHPASAARLYAWALYGPAVPSSQTPASQGTTPTKSIGFVSSKTVLDLQCPGGLTFKGGNHGASSLILKHELMLLLQDMAKQFVVEVYDRSPLDSAAIVPPTISGRDYETLLQKAPRELSKALEFTVEEVKELALRALRRSEKKAKKAALTTLESKMSFEMPGRSMGADASMDGQVLSKSMSPENSMKKEQEAMFTIFSEVILQERSRRAKALRSSSVKLEDIRSDIKVLKPKQVAVYNKSHLRPYHIDDWSSPVKVTRSLHRNGAAVCSIDGCGPAITDVLQNVRLLRHDSLQDKPRTEGWDSHCCIRNKGLGTMVGKSIF